jgi:hypothetical protein
MNTPVQTECRRCSKLFCYFRRTKPRMYCPPCAELELQDTNDFSNNRARGKRLAARMNAWLAHQEAI